MWPMAWRVGRCTVSHLNYASSRLHVILGHRSMSQFYPRPWAAAGSLSVFCIVSFIPHPLLDF
jgi:hypothetical protein